MSCNEKARWADTTNFSLPCRISRARGAAWLVGLPVSACFTTITATRRKTQGDTSLLNVIPGRIPRNATTGFTVTTIERSALVAYSDEEMFELVCDVERYPEFMPGCVKTELLGKGDGWMEAKLHLGKGRLNQSFTTYNRIDRPRTMELTLKEGPFKRFHGLWTFTALADRACKLELKLEFEFANKLVAMAAGKLFESVANQQVAAICQRAKQIYG